MYGHILIGGAVLGFFGHIGIQAFQYITLKSIEYGQNYFIVKILFSIMFIFMWSLLFITARENVLKTFPELNKEVEKRGLLNKK